MLIAKCPSLQLSWRLTIVTEQVLIVNTNGGGHAPIGFWLSKKLAENGHQVFRWCLNKVLLNNDIGTELDLFNSPRIHS